MLLSTTACRADSFQLAQNIITCLTLYMTIIQPIHQQISRILENDESASGQLILGVVASEDDYYTLLGVEKKSTKQEIQKAFRRLAKKYHPDKNKDKNAQDEFIKIVKAYETLSDEKKRKEYDNRSSLPGGQQWSTQGFNMNEFDINEFFRQYEDQFMRHAPHHSFHHENAHHQHHHQHQQHQHHHQQHQYHHRTSFGGIDLDDLFHNLDDDEWQFLGNPFASHGSHYSVHHHASEGWNTISPEEFGDGRSFFGNLDELQSIRYGHQAHANVHTSGYSCRTITRQVNGVSMTQTQCS